MKPTAVLTLACLLVAALASAQTPQPRVYVVPTDDGFQTYVTAALLKKKVPVIVSTAPEGATLTLTTAQIEVEKVSTGAKVVKCLFANCAGSEDKASTSATLTDSTGAVIWSYSVNKGRGAKNRQSMAESIAEHLRDDYFKKLRPAR